MKKNQPEIPQWKKNWITNVKNSIDKLNSKSDTSKSYWTKKSKETIQKEAEMDSTGNYKRYEENNEIF